jgi:hypothetical protein
MPKFRKKPVVIEAIQYTGHNDNELSIWSNKKVYASPICEPSENNLRGNYTQIDTVEGTLTAIPGDWIVKGESSELGVHFWPVKPDYFAENYDLVSE